MMTNLRDPHHRRTYIFHKQTALPTKYMVVSTTYLRANLTLLVTIFLYLFPHNRAWASVVVKALRY